MPEAGFAHGGEGQGVQCRRPEGATPATPCGGRILGPVQWLTEMSIVTGILAETADVKVLSGLPKCLLLSDVSTLSGKVWGKYRRHSQAVTGDGDDSEIALAWRLK